MPVPRLNIDISQTEQSTPDSPSASVPLARRLRSISMMNLTAPDADGFSAPFLLGVVAVVIVLVRSGCLRKKVSLVRF